MTKLIKNSSSPLYAQLKRLITTEIETGVWLPGQQIPSEREMCAEYGISRITVRQAIAELVAEGKLETSPGRGTFVAERHIEQRITRLTGFTQDMMARKQRPGGRVLRFEEIQAPLVVARALKIEVNSPVILLKRLRTSENEPLALETAYLLWSLCKTILSENLENRSLYQLLSEKAGVIPTRAEQTWQAIQCQGDESKLLGIPPGSPALYIHRTTYNQENQPFEWVESFYRGDRYIFRAELAVE